MPHRVVAEEQELLAGVLAALDSAPARAAPSEAAIVRELERLRAVLVEGGEAKDQGALMQQWDQQSALLRQLRASREQPQVARETPYFAHLRLREDGRDWDLCLGKATLISRGVRIVDWRHAPVSRIFYRYRQGDDYEEEIAGRSKSGTVLARRTVTIRGAQLEGVDCPEGIFRADAALPGAWRQLRVEGPRLAGGQGAAVRAYDAGSGTERRLGTDGQGMRHRPDKHLPDIAGLIDPEQFQLITRAAAGLVVIRGGAGSGKTTVALHRIAYLAYDDDSVDSDRTLVVVFSHGLRNYVSHVLPALGVQRVQVCTLRDWTAEHCRRLFPMLPRTTREHTPAVVQRLKLHPALLAALQAQAERVPGPATPRQVIDDWASVLSREDLLAPALTAAAPGEFSADDLTRATAWQRQRCEELRAWMRGDKHAPAELDAEDAALLLRAWQVRAGSLPGGRGGKPLRYRHIAIDEVQDFSPLEVRVLLDCLDERRSMTLAGDTQQHVMRDAGFTSWSAFFAHLGVPGTAVDTLRVSYRSSRPIVEFAGAVLGPLQEDDPPPLTTRSGPAVELFRFTDHGACVAFLCDALTELMLREALASVAVLTPSRSLSELYYQGLARSEVPRLRWVQQQDFSFAPGVEITEIEQVKGLEFDYVILIEVSAANFPADSAARRLLHVGATRAVHQLWLTSVATPSALVRDAAS